MISDSENFSNSLNYSVNKIVSQKQVFKLGPNEKTSVNLLISVSKDKYEAIKNLNENYRKIIKTVWDEDKTENVSENK